MRELNTQEIKQVNGGWVPVVVFIARAIALEYFTTVRHAH